MPCVEDLSAINRRGADRRIADQPAYDGKERRKRDRCAVECDQQPS
ncbi:hypothetical protein [Sphingomonas sp. TREG-RG-20F-R18-01]|nr:hypothetical protein [Sphingomonas sp. TREG-RG-20F-R18-01]